VILAFYRFARGADDVADNASLTPDAKLALLDQFEATLTGRSDTIAAARPLRTALAARKLPPRHALDLLRAFRMDAIKHRYANWSELLDYCAYSAAPVGRFVLDVHRESQSTWAASDALCTALQINNHVQDCGADYRNLDRVYIPQDMLAAQGVGVDALGAPQASPALRKVLQGVAERNASLIALGYPLPRELQDFRLCLEIAVIVSLARQINILLLERDPLSEKVHLGKVDVLAASSTGIAEGLRAFFRPRRTAPTPAGGA
jgi:hydroxysqualene synthase